jgi:multicomponent Na+:H+ antiporter subunit F
MALSGVILAILVLYAVFSEIVLYVDVALVYDIFGFLGLLAIARFLPRSIKVEEEEKHNDS